MSILLIAGTGSSRAIDWNHPAHIHFVTIYLHSIVQLMARDEPVSAIDRMDIDRAFHD